MNRQQLYDFYKNEYLFMDGIETATLTPHDGSTAVDTAKVKREEFSKEALAKLSEDFIGDEYDLSVIGFVETMGGVDPRLGKVLLQETSESYRVKKAVLACFGTQWVMLLIQDRA